MRPLSQTFDARQFPNLIVGLEAADDAAVWRIDDEHAIIQTVDFFQPIVDDPYTFGAIAAANALSDVYAMGGEVLMALAIANMPETFSPELIGEIFRGAAAKVAEAGAVIAGGHTVIDPEPKYGLCVTGLVHPRHVVTKGGAQVGDRLLLTKKLGTGLIATANKRDQAQPEHVRAAVESMLKLNRDTARIMLQVGVHAATDITGYALLGHADEMAQHSPAGLRIFADDVPILEGALAYARMGATSGGTTRNRLYLEERVRMRRSLPKEMLDLLYDPQTSGGLLIATPPAQTREMLERFKTIGQDAWIVGEAIEQAGIEVV